MNKAILTVGIIFLGVVALLLLQVLNSYSTGSELDYYLVKETTDAAIEDSLDKYKGFLELVKNGTIQWNEVFNYGNGWDAAMK